MDLEELKNKLDENGIGKYFNRLWPLLRNTIRLYKKPADEDSIAIGQTRIGGKPDLPEEMAWPAETKTVEKKKFFIFGSKTRKTISRPLPFIAQINLSEASQYDTENLLPKSGLLYFFYSAKQSAWGSDYKDRNKFKIAWWDGNFNELRRAGFPEDLPAHSRYKPWLADMRREISLTSFPDELYENFSDQELDSLDVIHDNGNFNKLLGYPDNIQDEVEFTCELASNSSCYGKFLRDDGRKEKLLKQNAKNWRLLLQLDSGRENAMIRDDAGRLYFLIKKDDLRNRNFDKSWFCLQYT